MSIILRLGTDRSPGIMLLTLQDLFLMMAASGDDVQYEVSMTYIEVRGESVVCCSVYASIFDLCKDIWIHAPVYSHASYL